MNARLQALLQAAVSQELLPPHALQAPGPAEHDRPWPVVLLTALGAWLAAVPLIGLFALFLRDWMHEGAGTYVIGTAVLAAAIGVLRNTQLPIFVEQLALPAMLTGAGLLGFGLVRDLEPQAAGALGLAIALGCAAAVNRPWLRVLLGAACAFLFCALVWPDDNPHAWHTGLLMWGIAHLALVVWVGMLFGQWQMLGQSAAQTQAATALEPFAAGWLLQVLAGLAALSGMSFMMGGVLGGDLASDLMQTTGGPSSAAIVTQAGSAALALAAAYVAQRSWPALKQPRAAAVAVVLAGLSAFLPWLGAALLALAITSTTQRWRQAAASALTAAWIIGSFYYRLDWALATKAMVLTGCGAFLGLLAWSAPRALSGSSHAGASPSNPLPVQRAAPWLIALTVACTLAAANMGIAQKERTIAQGRKVFVELAPVDPRSLMQGDYMRLNFRLPLEGVSLQVTDTLQSGRLHAIGKLDERGVVQWLRTGPASEPLAPGEQRFELSPRDGHWTLVTDAWYFREGDGQRWEQARYGEFRVEPDGRALLVGMTNAQLQPIAP